MSDTPAPVDPVPEDEPLPSAQEAFGILRDCQPAPEDRAQQIRTWLNLSGAGIIGSADAEYLLDQLATLQADHQRLGEQNAQLLVERANRASDCAEHMDDALRLAEKLRASQAEVTRLTEESQSALKVGKAAARLLGDEMQRAARLQALNRSEQFQNGPTKRAEAAEARLAALVTQIEQKVKDMRTVAMVQARGSHDAYAGGVNWAAREIERLLAAPQTEDR